MASGTQLIQELVSDGIHEIKKYEPKMEKTMRLVSVTSTIENGFVHLPDRAPWLGEYLHELTSFPNAKYDDQTDSTSQALDWFKSGMTNEVYGVLELARKMKEEMKTQRQAQTVPSSRTCPNCGGIMAQPIPGGLRCAQCAAQWPPLGTRPPVLGLNRKDILERFNL